MLDTLELTVRRVWPGRVLELKMKGPKGTYTSKPGSTNDAFYTLALLATKASGRYPDDKTLAGLRVVLNKGIQDCASQGGEEEPAAQAAHA